MTHACRTRLEAQAAANSGGITHASAHMSASGQPSYARKRRADGAAGWQLELHPRVFGGQCCADAMVGLDVWVRSFVSVSARFCLLPSL